MNKRLQEWDEILNLGKTNEYFKCWLDERTFRYNAGISTDAHVTAIRKEYRKFKAGKIDAGGRGIK